MKNEDCFSKLKNKCPDDEEIQRTKEIIERFRIKNGEDLTHLYLKNDDIFSADVLRNLLKYLLKNMEITLYIVFTWLHLAMW